MLAVLDSIKLDWELLEKQQDNLLDEEEDWSSKDLAAIVVGLRNDESAIAPYKNGNRINEKLKKYCSMEVFKWIFIVYI